MLLQAPPLGKTGCSSRAGALLAALIVRLSPESGGHGVVEVIEAVHKPPALRSRAGCALEIARRRPVIGSGGSAGREGPVSTSAAPSIFALAVSRLAEKPRLDSSRRRRQARESRVFFPAPLAGSLFRAGDRPGGLDVRRFAPVVLAPCRQRPSPPRARSSAGGQRASPVAWSWKHPSERSPSTCSSACGRAVRAPLQSA